MVDLNILNFKINIRPNMIYNVMIEQKIELFLEFLKNYMVFIDLIVFTEVFNLQIIKRFESFFKNNKWEVVILGEQNSVINGGIVVGSKWQVQEKLEDYYINCDIDDCLTSRGPLLLKISHPLFKYNVIANSFQERNNQLEDIRKLQINQLSLWIKNNIKYNSNDLIMIVGNFNISERENIFKYMVKKFNSQVIKHHDEHRDDCNYILNLNNRLKLNYNFNKIDGIININGNNSLILTSIELST